MPLKLIRQDITKMNVDAIVTSTNRGLIGFSGVDLAIHKAAGPLLEERCKELAPIERGTCVVTFGYNLNCKYIIHACGPIWCGGQKNETEVLMNCYRSCLNIAKEKQCKSVALPLISSGAYDFPKSDALRIAVHIITDFLFKNELNVYLCLFDKESYELSGKIVTSIEAFIDDNYVTENEETFLCRYSSCIRPNNAEIVRMHLFEKCADDAPMGYIRETSFPEKCCTSSLDEKIGNLDKPFSYTLFELIDKSGMTDVECYKRANVDRKTFSKIKCYPDTYKPSKETAVAFSLALKLNFEETQAFLATAGLTLSHCFVFDIIIEYFIKKGVYDISIINQYLFDKDQPCLGCIM